MESIGKIETLQGTVTVTRVDGTIDSLNVGDDVFQGDVIQSDADSGVGIVLADNTTFSMAENGNMTLDEMVYDSSTQEGNIAFSVAEGVFTFVSGEIAKTDPDAMTLSTPVATIGIRGTQIGINIGADGETDLVLMEEGDGFVGEVVVTNSAGVMVLNQVHQALEIAGLDIPMAELRTLTVDQLLEVFGDTLKTLPKIDGNNVNNYNVSDTTEVDALADFETAVGQTEAEPEKIDVKVSEVSEVGDFNVIVDTIDTIDTDDVSEVTEVTSQPVVTSIRNVTQEPVEEPVDPIINLSPEQEATLSILQQAETTLDIAVIQVQEAENAVASANDLATQAEAIAMTTSDVLTNTEATSTNSAANLAEEQFNLAEAYLETAETTYNNASQAAIDYNFDTAQELAQDVIELTIDIQTASELAQVYEDTALEGFEGTQAAYQDSISEPVPEPIPDDQDDDHDEDDSDDHDDHDDNDNKGHGNNEDGQDDDNPGKGKGERHTDKDGEDEDELHFDDDKDVLDDILPPEEKIEEPQVEVVGKGSGKGHDNHHNKNSEEGYQVTDIDNSDTTVDIT